MNTAASTPSSTVSSSALASTSTSAAASSWSRGASASDNVVKCECGVPAAERTVTRETTSKGKKFWTCPRGVCSFFQWMEDGLPGSATGNGPRTSSSSVPAKRSYSSTRDTSSSDGPKRMCKCSEEAVQLTVQKEGANKGRKFWKCKKGDNGSCGFFEWDDQPPQNAGPSNRPGGMSSRTQSMNSTGGAGSSTDVCFKCDQTGHWASACPNGDNASNKRARSFGTNANTPSDAECFKCHQLGHYSSACPNGGTSYGGGGTGKSTFAGNDSSGNTCFKCECPQDNTTTSKRGRGRGGGGTSSRSKRGRGGSRKKSTFAAADEW
ncbi:hypothetical protein CVT26_005039 [Gymnopilus dilepis]|uniref:CCHC-type domain-containing protein n=1 Tax=Gymnopilus dilepis TaxID=231916 RepID=A0A409WWP5_9AGAR|nr:hypothetical protein CVT26_005039 [Gymnopilus dilepis]